MGSAAPGSGFLGAEREYWRSCYPWHPAPVGFGTRRGQARLGRSGGTVQVCARAGARAAGEGPGGLRRAGPLSVSGLRGLRGSRPPRGFSREPATCLPFFAGGRAPGPGRQGARAPFFSRWRSGSGCWPPHVSGPYESGSARALSGSACPEARRLAAGWVPARRGRPRRRRARCPPPAASTWSGLEERGVCRCSRGGGSPPAPDAAPAPAGSSRDRRPRPQPSPGFLARLLW